MEEKHCILLSKYDLENGRENDFPRYMLSFFNGIRDQLSQKPSLCTGIPHQTPHGCQRRICKAGQ